MRGEDSLFDRSGQAASLFSGSRLVMTGHPATLSNTTLTNNQQPFVSHQQPTLLLSSPSGPKQEQSQDNKMSFQEAINIPSWPCHFINHSMKICGANTSV